MHEYMKRIDKVYSKLGIDVLANLIQNTILLYTSLLRKDVCKCFR